MTQKDNNKQNKVSPRAYKRERGEPSERDNPIPKTFLVFSIIIVIWGMSYFYTRIGGQTGAGDTRSPMIAKTGGAIDGAALYAANCVACHQASGQGLAGVFPPLDGSGWVQTKPEVPVQILLHGITGKIVVKGTTYQSVMPSFATMSDAEIAAIVSHIRQSWSNKASAVNAEFVAKQRKQTADREAPWNGGAELKKEVGSPQ
ncbi:MAG TPA: c-type cytochrome [Gammaproteobacteria bacterium]|nr:c-type cytochrome [Gammaproteobacteria bacterium]